MFSPGSVYSATSDVCVGLLSSPSLSISDVSAICVSQQGRRQFLDIMRSSNGGQVSSPTLIICLLSIGWMEGGERKRGRWWYVVEFLADERMPCLREFGEMELPLVRLDASLQKARLRVAPLS